LTLSDAKNEKRPTAQKHGMKNLWQVSDVKWFTVYLSKKTNNLVVSQINLYYYFQLNRKQFLVPGAKQLHLSCCVGINFQNLTMYRNCV
jgi:hypothetical protein